MSSPTWPHGSPGADPVIPGKRVPPGSDNTVRSAGPVLLPGEFGLASLTARFSSWESRPASWAAWTVHAFALQATRRPARRCTGCMDGKLASRGASGPLKFGNCGSKSVWSNTPTQTMLIEGRGSTTPARPSSAQLGHGLFGGGSRLGEVLLRRALNVEPSVRRDLQRVEPPARRRAAWP